MGIAILVMIAASLPPGSTTLAEAGAEDWPRGVHLDSVTSLSDSSQTYAVYLPPGYGPHRDWPVVMLMDPRGRARVPLERFQSAARRLGYVLISSYGTASDTFEDVNTPAVRAMFDDAHALLASDSRRFHLAGFSGTARIAWTFAQRLTPPLAGLLGFSGALPRGENAPWDAHFAVFGAAGLLDYNYEEMRTLDRNLDVREQPHRFEYFEGGHRWAPAEVCGRGLEFMELDAMRRDLIPRDAAVIDTIHRAQRARAEAATDSYDAYVRYRALAEDFAGLLDASTFAALQAKVAALESSQEVQDALRRREASSRMFREHRRRFEAMVEASRLSDDWTAERMISHLEIHGLRRRAEDSGDPEAARAARRVLELIYVHTSFYLPHDDLGRGDHERALTALQVAAAIRPLDAKRLERSFAPLRDDPRFLELVGSPRQR